MRGKMKYSAGILVARTKREIEFLLVHLGGPLWEGRDEGAWSFPKGLIEDDEQPLETAKREWKEETSLPLPNGECIPLPSLFSKNKTVFPFLMVDDVDTADFQSNLFSMEWPKGSQQFQEFPEADRIAWCSKDDAMIRIHKYLRPVIMQAVEYLS